MQNQLAIPLILICQSLLFSTILLSKTVRKKRANYYLSFFFLAITGQFIWTLLSDLNIEGFNVHDFVPPFGFLYGPSLYLYSKSLTGQDNKIISKSFGHFLPFFIFSLFSLISNSLSSFSVISMYISLIVYTYLAVTAIHAFKAGILRGRHKKININLKWLQYFMAIFLAILLLDIVDQTLLNLTVFDGISMVHLAVLVLVNWAFFKGFHQPSIFQLQKIESSSIRKGGNSYPLEADDELLLEKIESLMQDRKIFKESDLTLTGFAEMAGFDSRKISALINNHFKQNFSGYVNIHRIDYARKMLRNFDKSEKSISEIMYDSGFTSKSSFNTLFRNRTGLTPSQYREMNKK